ncbi:unnamed protein product, partial [Vitis vinifera]|uniref:Uncharacterized protein n=1 Tax=Vitis vinifera TaxID=29760 RepID=D7UDU7_VITVI
MLQHHTTMSCYTTHATILLQ